MQTFKHTYGGFESLNILQNDRLESLDYLIKKGLYPYKWANKFEKFTHTKLPPRECFFNNLIDAECSIEYYEIALEVWNYFTMKIFEDYYDLYLLTDVMLLADVFDNFRKTCLEYYELDSCNYLTLSMFS